MSSSTSNTKTSHDADDTDRNTAGVTRVPTRYRRRVKAPSSSSSPSHTPPIVKPTLQVDTENGKNGHKKPLETSSTNSGSTPLSEYSTPVSAWSTFFDQQLSGNNNKGSPLSGDDNNTPPLDRNPFHKTWQKADSPTATTPQDNKKSTTNNRIVSSSSSSMKEKSSRYHHHKGGDNHNNNNSGNANTTTPINSSNLRRSHTHHKSSSQTKIRDTPTPSFPIKIQLPSQNISKEVTLDTRISDLLEDLVSTYYNELPGEDANDYMLWEVVVTFGIKRPLRSYEILKFIKASWESSTSNYLQIGPSSKREEVDSIAFLAPRRDLYNGGKAFFKGSMSYLKPSKSHIHEWRKGWIDVTNNHLVLRKREHGTDIRSLNITEFELYEYRKSKLSTLKSLPGKYTLILRSQQSPDFFLNKGDATLFLSTNSHDDYDNLRNIIYSLRSSAFDKMVTAYNQSLQDDGDGGNNDHTQHTNLLNIHGYDNSQNNHHTTQNDIEQESIPLAQLQLENQEIKKEGLLGEKYEKKFAYQQTVNNPNAIEPPKFTKNSLLATAKAPSNSAGKGAPIPTEDQSPFERGLMGRTYTTKVKTRGASRSTSHNM